MSITSCPGVTELALVSIAKFCPSLKQLYLRKCSQISDGLLKDFTEASKVLENLQIEECNRFRIVHRVDGAPDISSCPAQWYRVISGGNRELISASGLKHYVESLMKREDIEFNVVLTQMNGNDYASKSIHVFHIGKLRVKLRKGRSTKARESYSTTMKSFPELAELDLSNCIVSDYGVTVLASVERLKLRLLSLSGCLKVTPKSVPFLEACLHRWRASI
ncbi:stomatal closure-related actin-binding protein 1-like [Hordeum vulgare]|nr:stomatal closure-related actin-binding protein 1-like [Hordeum vulgare]